MTPAKLTCRELIEFLGQYLDGELPADQRETFERHLAICPACADYLASYRETIRLGKSACTSGQELADDVPSDLIVAILASRTRP